MVRERATLRNIPHPVAAGILERVPQVPTHQGADTFTIDVPPLSPAYRFVKRALDILVSAAVLLVLSPLLAAVTLLIVLTSEGPAFFRQQRVGEGGRIFTMYKFRSMYSNADATLHQIAYAHFVEGHGGNGKVDRESLLLAGVEVAESSERVPDEPQATHFRWLRGHLHRLRPLLHAEDPRITPLGALIRVTSIDELPQFLNVLRGDMTLVGPRPPIPYEVRLYKSKHMLRLTVQPGVTGIWQVYGRNKVPFEQMVDMDIEYIQRRSLWLDLELIVKTIPAVLFSRSAK